MARHITIFGPRLGQKLVLVFESRIYELKVADLKQHFDLTNDHISLRPLTLLGAQVKVGVSKTNEGEDAFLLDHELHQFYKVDLSIDLHNSTISGSKGVPVPSTDDCANSTLAPSSVIDMIQTMPLQSNLHVALKQVKDIFQVEELPLFYDGYVAYELPPSGLAPGMQGMEQRHDNHMWTEYVTCSSDCFNGVVRFSRCSGHLRCINLDCPFYVRTNLQNEVQWRGRLCRSSPKGLISPEYGTLACLHCGQTPECVATCPAVIYYCLPKDKQTSTRCVLHLGEHKHPCAEGRSRSREQNISEMLQTRASHDPFTTAKQLERATAQELIMETLIDKDSNAATETIGDGEFAEFLDTITPLSSRRRAERSLEYAKSSRNITGKGLEAVLELKSKCKYPFIHSVLFSGQLDHSQQPHVFKMSVKGPGSGVDLVNRMRPDGNLGQMWVHFDHVHRVRSWPTMSAHVYDPFVRELLTIATCEFTVENKYAQIEFWRMLNKVVMDQGFEQPEFRGFMADEANANWIAVRTVYFGGVDNITPSKERSCLFHWEQSMVRHTSKCIRSASQEEHKILCRKWRNASTENAAEVCKGEIQRFWKAGHAIQGEIASLETWLAWWDARVSHWGARFVSQDESGVFVPTTNLSETKHASMRASIGYKEHISLYEAACADMAMAVLQSVKYNAYLKGMRTSTGPSIQDLAERFLNDPSSTGAARKLVDLTHSGMQEMGIDSPEMNRTNVRERSVRKKRPIFVDADVLLEEDSHRPEFVTVTKPITGSGNREAAAGNIGEPWPEVNVSPAVWAIRRTEPGRKMTCFGIIANQSDRCGRFINDDSLNAKLGVPAPCFCGRRKYPSSGSQPGGLVEGYVWFCNTNTMHTWKIHDMIVGPPGPAPGLWVVAQGTNLMPHEADKLQANGFVLQKGEGSAQIHNGMQKAKKVPSGFRPKYRDGKIVKWRSKLTKEFENRINLCRTMTAQLVREVIVVCNETHVFYLNTEGSTAKGVTYSITLSDFPRCTCEDFQKRESKRLTYVPCKHLYYVYLQILGLDPQAHEFIHQAALTKVELFQALGGVRVNVQN